jgi:hypothetical protein
VSPAVQVGANRQQRSDELTVLKAPERKRGWSIRRRRNWWKTLVRVTQNTRLAGFFNHKRAQPHLVTIDYWNVDVCCRFWM